MRLINGSVTTSINKSCQMFFNCRERLHRDNVYDAICILNRVLCYYEQINLHYIRIYNRANIEIICL